MINPVTTEKNGIYLENGAYYYYADGVKAYAGLIRYTGTADDGTVYDNAYIYVCSNGQLATGKYWITKSNGLMDAKTYSFNEKGIMDVRNGIFAENNSLYYYVDGILAKGKGLIKIDGNYYYVRSSGEVVNNCDYWITNVNEYNVLKKTYAFDKNGVMQDVEMSDSNLNGVVDGFYYVDGQIKYGAGPIVWNGDIYYVRSNGMVATDKYWTTTQNEILPSGQYVFDENGKLIQD
jgi:glucan-binding YG repeat protein